ncbi:MAG: hypothetical protein Q8R28_20440 [Dehalococcoidia bacterium]|nr:hypothetical protein [Dehalococcoidia bacterium]
MAKAVKRVRLESGTDLVRLLEAVHSEGTPCLIERAGESLAVVIHPDEYGAGAAMPNEEGIARALKAAGAWEDMDTDALLESTYRARHAGPASRPVSL